MYHLPLWVLPNSKPGFYDTESATCIEMTAKVYKAMQDLIEEYNQFASNVNIKIDEFMSGAKKDYEVFTTELRQEFQDFIDVIELKIQSQDKTISDGLETLTTNNENFKQSLLQIQLNFQNASNTKYDDFEKTILLHIENQDQVIADAVAYMKDNIRNSLHELLLEMRENGELTEAIYKAFDNINATVTNLSNTHQTDMENLATQRTNDLNKISTDISAVDSKISYASPKMYGAKGDGVTDDTQAFLDLLNENSFIFIPTGQYIVSSSFNISGKTIVGGGRDSLLIAKNVTSLFTGETIRTTLTNFRIQGVYNSVHADFLFDGSVKNLVMDKMEITHFSSIFCANISQTSRIVNSIFQYITNSFVKKVSSTPSIIDSVVKNNYISGTSYADENTICFNCCLANSVIADNFIDYFTKVFYTESSGSYASVIKGNRFDRNFRVFSGEIPGFAIIGNIFSNIQYDAAGWANRPEIENDFLKTDNWWCFYNDKHGFINVLIENNWFRTTCPNCLAFNGQSLARYNINHFQFRNNHFETEYEPIFDLTYRMTARADKETYYLKGMDIDVSEKEYDELPNPAVIYQSDQFCHTSYHGQKIYYKNMLLTNLHGNWYKTDGPIYAYPETE